jgi:ABC-2 type transport system ATP-binding protein
MAQEKKSNKKNIIEIENLVKDFDAFRAVDNISLEVSQGEIFAFLGPNGAGKTTTIKILTTLLQPASGKIRIVGHDPVTHQHEVRKTFGIVFQDPSLDDELTALENMQFHAVLYGISKKVYQKRIQQLMEVVELWDRRHSLVKEFSGGMKRRLEIARGLVHHPKILYLDEPTIGLDPQTRNHIWSYIKNLSKEEGITVFLTTHYMEEAEKMADRIAIIDNGKIVAKGTADELKKQTSSQSLEDAFLSLTGKVIREQEAEKNVRMRRAHGGR